MISKTDAETFFKTYEKVYRDAIAGNVNLNDVAGNYSTGFVSVTPAGVMVGENGQQLKDIMKKGFEAYRAMGSKKMTCKEVSVTPIDQDHCVAKVQWSGEYERKDKSPVTIDFEVDYLLERRDGSLKVFGWIAGDEQAEFKKHGLA
ncbi:MULTISPECIES: nuclear transport factor 2 family protein [Mesorhizobium]|uniref:Nuclear transport factor 2 family protein n=1 Tax=Mesorhizobium shonense TaxID=1209948 RepID=A0ABV2HYB2_9HYPH|nr:nuclear transport factor 2 family protein [Mesorhizobium sp.]RWB20161.1 MAG: nuclear transport factor 2 family protein [Mesorhizobium sp.]RWE03277.1 MAG: nuclear transport factor 2 family protein [Mesorhizobium sp.]TIS47217.1 MAG: nuclear transport factor 2 family protein [Mesorhizobium sp.]TIT87057.1 MAG: nuclear transport factor 2 family protein [Mesorhizobium sp.]